jgi:hypothetical protein
MLAPVSEAVLEWLKASDFDDAWIFGSLIHKKGIQFSRENSDVDVICRFGAPDNYFSRWRSVTSATDAAGHLNLMLLRVFERKDATGPIVSIVPVTQSELDTGLHKDKANQFFSANKFYNVKSKEAACIGKEHTYCSVETESRYDAIRETQRYRNKFLSVAPAGGRAVEDYDGPDPLPKQLCRAAAQTRWALEPKHEEDERFDVNEGLVYVSQLLTSRRRELTLVNDLLQRLMIRMGRGARAPLTPQDQLLLWEILADDAAMLTPAEKEAPKGGLTKSLKNEALKRAAYSCSFPGCGVPLGVEGIGEVAFIRSPARGGPRYDGRLSRDQTFALDNLLVLCPTHHRLIDHEQGRFRAKELRSWNAGKQSEHPVINARNLFTIIRLITNLLG